MKHLQAQSDAQTPADFPVLPAVTLSRLHALGVVVALCDAAGKITLQSPCESAEQLVVTSRLFANQLSQCAGALFEHEQQAQQLMPGVYVVPLPTERRRRASQQSEAFYFAVLFTHELLTSEQFVAVCQNHEVDLQATVAKVSTHRLLRETDISRMALTVSWLQQDACESHRLQADLSTMGRQLGDSYEELSLLFKFATNMLVNQPPETLLADAVEELAQVMGVRWLVLQLNKDESRLNELSGKLFLAGSPECERDELRSVGRQLMSMQVSSDRPQLVDDTSTMSVRGLAELGRNLIVVPLRNEDSTLGIIYGCDKIDGSMLTSVDSKLCSSLASTLSIFLENTMLFEDMQAMFLGTLHALTNAIDAKDSYTHGHSERVALMSRMLAEAAGLDAFTVERIYISGLIHDVGKIGVPESVLSKPGKLTDEEFGLIRMHPEIGGRILQDIRQMQDLIPGVLYHHERWDGRGYPHGLSGEDIPLFGRVICLADSFDAMSSTRTYRRPIEAGKVLTEIRNCAGSQFDPELAELFVELDFEPFRDLIAKHQGNLDEPDPNSPDNQEQAA